MDPSMLALADALSKVGAVALLALEVILLVRGILRPGALVDAERDRILAERDKRELVIAAERDRRETQLIAERDAWRDRSIATDARLDRIAHAFGNVTGAAAPE